MRQIKMFIDEAYKYGKIVSKEYSVPFICVWCSIIIDFIKYGASPANYQKFNFCEINSKQKRTYVTNRVSRRLIKKYNDPHFENIFEDKVKFAETFSPFFGRRWIFADNCTASEWEKLSTANKVICKPIGGSQGRGIAVIRPSAYSLDEIREKFSGCIIEEFIQQHHLLNSIYDKAVNCLRVITILKEDKLHILVANLTFGSEFEIANASYGGITAEVDVCNGIIISDGGQFGHHVFKEHPYSGKAFRGLEIPYWNQVIQMLEQCSRVVPQIGYVGWDIAITENGPVIIEGNTTPGYTYFQIPEILDNKNGVLENYRKWL